MHQGFEKGAKPCSSRNLPKLRVDSLHRAVAACYAAAAALADARRPSPRYETDRGIAAGAAFPNSRTPEAKMLRIDVEGDTHPKTFKLVTDDAQAELLRLTDILDEVDAAPDDATRIWLDSHSADDFAEGVEIPTGEVGEFGELLEMDWPDEAEKIRRQAEDALDQAAAAMERDEAAESGDQ